MQEYRKVWVSVGGDNEKAFVEGVLPVGMSYPKNKVVHPLFSKKQLEDIQKVLREGDCYAEFDEEKNEFVICDIPFEGDHSKEQDLVDEFFQYYPIEEEGIVEGEQMALCEFASHWGWEYKGEVLTSVKEDAKEEAKEFEVHFILSGNMVITANTKEEARVIANSIIHQRISDAENLFGCGLADDDYTTDVLEV